MTIARLEIVQAQETVRASVIECLERVLTLAREGKLQSVAIAGVGSNGWAFTKISVTRSRFEMLGAVSLLQHQILMDVNEDSEDGKADDEGA